MDEKTRDDFRWLISTEAAEILDQTREALLEKINIVRVAKTLRAKTTVARAALVIEQSQLRNRARKKFALADQMFFTRKGLEQASSQEIASYKSSRFDDLASVVDICCGIGGDLMAMAQRDQSKRTVGIDSDDLTCLFARKNLSLLNLNSDEHKVRVRRKSFGDFDCKKYRGLHIDPDRRAQERTVVGTRFSPPLKEIFERISPRQNVAIKVAPATVSNQRFPANCHREWIGDRRECKQQIIWCGPFTQQAGCRSATYIDRRNKIHRISIAEDEVDQTIVFAKKLSNYVYEPHPAVSAAKLIDALASKYDIHRFSAGIAYLTGARKIDDPLLRSFEIRELLPMDLRQTVSFLKRKDIGSVVIKNRGIEQVVVDKFKRMKLQGPNRATLILTRIGNRRINIVTARKPNDF